MARHLVVGLHKFDVPSLTYLAWWCTFFKQLVQSSLPKAIPSEPTMHCVTVSAVKEAFT